MPHAEFEGSERPVFRVGWGAGLRDCWPGEVKHVELEAAGGDAIEQAVEELVHRVSLAVSGVDQVYPEPAARVLLQRCRRFHHVDVEQHVARRGIRVRLETEAHPAVLVVVAL